MVHGPVSDGASSKRAVPATRFTTMFVPDCAMLMVLEITVSVELVAVTPATVALIFAVPGPTAVTTPLESTVSTAGLPLVQALTAPVRLTSETCAKLPVTAACSVWPNAKLAPADTLIDEGGGVGHDDGWTNRGAGRHINR